MMMVEFRCSPSPVEVQNLPPNILQTVAPPEVAEGHFPFTVIAQDPGNDPMSYAIDVDGDGVFEQIQNERPTFELNYPDNDFYTLNVQVCDNALACQTKASTISVGNVPPQILEITTNSPIQEGRLCGAFGFRYRHSARPS